jgi:hypothetical protein
VNGLGARSRLLGICSDLVDLMYRELREFVLRSSKDILTSVQYLME